MEKKRRTKSFMVGNLPSSGQIVELDESPLLIAKKTYFAIHLL